MRQFRLLAACVGVFLWGTACSLSDLVNVDPKSLGSDVDPKDIHTYPAAVLMYNRAVGFSASAWSDYALTTAYWTDELSNAAGSVFGVNDFDARLPSSTENLSNGYLTLQRARGTTALAIDALRAHQRAESRPLLAELFALQGYMIVMLAEGFCAGVPMSQMTVDGEMTLSAGLSTEELFTQAIALFDSAALYAPDSVRLQTLIHVGAARALLNLGKYTDAKREADRVPMNGDYRLYYSPADPTLAHWSETRVGLLENQKGRNGLSWIASSPETQDARLPVLGNIQRKFPGNVTSASLADATEARLIVAEAQLHSSGDANDDWLRTLNELRALWSSISGDRELSDLTDPIIPQERIDLLFTERAFWLYLTGHRQGDLRRLVRLYERLPSKIYPWGDYPNALVAARYADEVVIGIHSGEKNLNRKFEGCHDFNP